MLKYTIKSLRATDLIFYTLLDTTLDVTVLADKYGLDLLHNKVDLMGVYDSDTLIACIQVQSGRMYNEKILFALVVQKDFDIVCVFREVMYHFLSMGFSKLIYFYDTESEKAFLDICNFTVDVSMEFMRSAAMYRQTQHNFKDIKIDSV